MIKVRRYHQIMMWPLLLRSSGSPDEAVETLLDRVTFVLCRGVGGASTHWTWPDAERWNTTRQIDLGTWYGGDEAYSEIAYFHSFVRDFLYGDGNTPPERRPVRVLRRTDVTGVEIKLAEKDKPDRHFDLDVERIELYLFDTATAILVVEVSKHYSASNSRQPDLTLRDVLDLQDSIRHVFPRRWKGEGRPDHCPRSMKWKRGANNTAGNKATDGGDSPQGPGAPVSFEGEAVSNFDRRGEFTQHVLDTGELPAASHWQFLLRPLRLYGGTGSPGTLRSAPTYQQIQDQRLPTMTYIAVDEPRQISDYDYARLAFVDGSGDSRVGSYSEEFLHEWHKKYAYDRFWLRKPCEENGNPIRSDDDDMTTRWLCSGYGLAVVGPQNNKFYREQILANFRHHYFRMGLIVHFHRASLLMLRDRMARGVDLLGRGEPTPGARHSFMEAATAVQRAMMRFRTRYWFREISTQLQGQELFTWWSGLLGNKDLFDQVAADIDSACAVVAAEQEKEETHFIKWLTVAATIAGIASIVASVLGLMTIDPEKSLDWGVALLWVKKFLLALVPATVSIVIIGLIVCLAWLLMARLVRGMRRRAAGRSVRSSK